MKRLIISCLLICSTVSAYEIEVHCTYRLRTTRFDTDGTRINGWGSAVSINLTAEGSYMLTAAHCVTSKTEVIKSIEIETLNGWVPVSINKIDEELDICLLTSPKLNTGLDLGNVDLKLGDDLIITGCPEGIPPVSYNGKFLENNDLKRVARVTSGFKPGFSGGSVIYDNKLIGIITNGFLNKDKKGMDGRYAVYLPMRRILQFLKE